MVIPIIIGVLGTISKDLVRGLEDLEIGRRADTIEITALLRLAKILRRVLETVTQPPVKDSSVKKLARSIVIIILSAIKFMINSSQRSSNISILGYGVGNKDLKMYIKGDLGWRHLLLLKKKASVKTVE